MTLKSFNRREFRGMVLLSIFLSGASVLAQPAKSRHATGPDDVMRLVSKSGAAKAVSTLTQDGGKRWRDVNAGIETGTPAWIDVAEALLYGTDAGNTTDLEFSLAIALTHNASGVLGLIGPRLKLESVCSTPYIEAPVAKNKDFTRRAINSVLRVDSPQLEPQKAACLTSLRGAAKAK